MPGSEFRAGDGSGPLSTPAEPMGEKQMTRMSSPRPGQSVPAVRACGVWEGRLRFRVDLKRRLAGHDMVWGGPAGPRPVSTSM